MTTGRLAVTGVGIVSALGHSAALTFERLVRGDRGIAEITSFDAHAQRARVAAEVRDFDPTVWERAEQVGPLSRSDALALAAARDALTSAGAGGQLPASRFGISVGATTGGIREAELILGGASSEMPPEEAARRVSCYPMSNSAQRLAAVFGAPARAATVCSACSSGANAIIQAALWLRNGDVDCVLAGGTDALSRLTVTGFNALGALDVAPCRPFDRSRGGLTLGEGAAFLLLETEESAARRGATVFAWLSSWAAGAEAHHITQPEPSARLPARLLRQAMERAGLGPASVDYLNAHGTGTSNDAVEAAGIRAAFGSDAERLIVSSSKGQIGHTLGAAGAIEAAITVLTLYHQQVPPTGGLREPDDTCRLNHVLEVGRPAPLRAALSSAFGFGGAGAVLLFERLVCSGASVAAGERRRTEPRRSIAVTGVATTGPGGVQQGVECAGSPEDPPTVSTGVMPRHVDRLEPARSRRFDPLSALITLGAERALVSAGLSPAGTGLIAGTAFGSVERTAQFLRIAFEKGPARAPPAEFPHLLPSAASGNASIYLGLTGPVMTASALDASAETAVLLACDVLAADTADAMVAGGVEVKDSFVRDLVGPACGLFEQGHHEEGTWLALESLERAAHRGVPLLALVKGWDEGPVETASTLRIEPPRDGDRAIVIGAAPHGALSEVANGSWSRVRHRPFSVAHGETGRAGFGLALATASIVRGEVDEALIVRTMAARLWAFHLTRSR
jgi:3-oxoacyl-[acyl-carrier-protein] synthase II